MVTKSHKILDWKLILIFIAVFWLFAYGFMILSYLFNSDLAEIIRHSTRPEKEIAQKYQTAIPLTNLVVLSSFAYVIGFFFAFVLSLFVGRNKPKFYRLNSVISLVLFWIIGKLGVTGWNYVKNIFLSLGK